MSRERRAKRKSSDILLTVGAQAVGTALGILVAGLVLLGLALIIF